MHDEANQLFLRKIPARKPTTKRPLIALHGWGRDHQSLMALADLLSEYRDVYLLDLPGFGKSPPPTLEGIIPSSADYAKWISNRLKFENLEAFDLLGHSFGGKVALNLAHQEPRARHLILMASPCLKARHPLSKRLRLRCLKLAAKALKTIDKLCHSHLFKNWFSQKFGSKDYKDAGIMRPVLVKSIQEELHQELSCLQIPSLLLWGEKDEDTSIEIAYRMQNLLPHSSLRALPLASHQLTQESPSLCAYYIEQFLSSEAS